MDVGRRRRGRKRMLHVHAPQRSLSFRVAATAVSACAPKVHCGSTPPRVSTLTICTQLGRLSMWQLLLARAHVRYTAHSHPG
eukprot:5667879-Pleurochrysis_carterae.AAC.2